MNEYTVPGAEKWQKAEIFTTVTILLWVLLSLTALAALIEKQFMVAAGIIITTIMMMIFRVKESALLRDSYAALKDDHAKLYQLASEFEAVKEKRDRLINQFPPSQEEADEAMCLKAQQVDRAERAKAKLLQEGAGSGIGDGFTEDLDQLERRHATLLSAASRNLSDVRKEFQDFRDLLIWFNRFPVKRDPENYLDGPPKKISLGKPVGQ